MSGDICDGMLQDQVDADQRRSTIMSHCLSPAAENDRRPVDPQQYGTSITPIPKAFWTLAHEELVISREIVLKHVILGQGGFWHLGAHS